MRLNRGTDSSMPTSPSPQTSNRNDEGTSYDYSVPTSPNESMDNYLAQGAPQQDSRKKPFSWHRYPFLSRFRSQSGKKEKHLIMSAPLTVNMKGLLLAWKVLWLMTGSIFHSISGRAKEPC